MILSIDVGIRNLAMCMLDEDLEKSKRFMKDLKRYYRSIDDLVKELA